MRAAHLEQAPEFTATPLDGSCCQLVGLGG